MRALAAFDDTALQALLETLDAVGRDINAVPDDLPRLAAPDAAAVPARRLAGDRPRRPHRTRPPPPEEPPPPPTRNRRTYDMNDTAEFTIAAIISDVQHST
jgi:hypothetical protein